MSLNSDRPDAGQFRGIGGKRPLIRLRIVFAVFHARNFVHHLLRQPHGNRLLQSPFGVADRIVHPVQQRAAGDHCERDRHQRFDQRKAAAHHRGKHGGNSTASGRARESGQGHRSSARSLNSSAARKSAQQGPLLLPDALLRPQPCPSPRHYCIYNHRLRRTTVKLAQIGASVSAGFRPLLQHGPALRRSARRHYLRLFVVEPLTESRHGILAR